MVQAIVVGVSTEEIGVIPRTLNPSAPFARKQQAQLTMFALGPADPALGEQKLVVSQRAHPEGCVKRIEQAGAAYGPLTAKYAKLAD
jgi:hypothetical protein